MARFNRFDRLRSILTWSLAILSALNGFAVALADAQPPRPPNIVFLVADDLGINDLGCYGRADHHTPMIDALAAQGVRFLSASSNASVCSPSRAAILTGQHSARLSLTTFLPGRIDRSSHRLLSPVINQHLPDGVKTLADLLKPVGYRSTCIGKWHLGHTGHGPTDHGFDSDFPGKSNPGAESVDGGKGELGQSAAAVQWIEAHADSHAHEPFFLYVAFDNPHIPLAASHKLIDANSKAFHPRYAAMIESLDTAVGRILNALERRSLIADTLVVFTSDNGGLHVPEGNDPPPTFNAPFRAGKGFLFEGGIRVPYFVSWKGKIAPGTKVTDPVSHIDLLPTLAAATGAQVPTDRPIDGVNLWPYMTGKAPATPPHEAIFWQDGPYMAVLKNGWKLQVAERPKKDWLFHLAEDPTEKTNLAASNPAKVEELKAAIAEHRRGGKTALYPFVGQMPVTIDKTLEQKSTEADEFIYWPG